MKIEVLDHGYVRFVEAWGHGDAGMDFIRNAITTTSDKECGIVEAARQSTQGSFRGWEKDAKLLEYLYSHNHMSPFEFAGMVIEVQAPIFVFREWHRHRTQSYNEMSARYEPLPDLYYRPSLERLLMRSQGDNRQTQGITQTPHTSREEFALVAESHIKSAYGEAQQTYDYLLQIGVPKELARLVMPVGHYSRMRAHANLRNWLAFLTLRMDPAAQWEIRQFANAVGQMIAQNFPRTWSLFNANRIPG